LRIVGATGGYPDRPAGKISTGGSTMISKILTKTALILFAILGVLFSLFGQEAAHAGRTDQPPVIDGVLNDAAWTKALVWSDFLTTKPDFGLPPTEKTELLFSSDSHHLFFAFRCGDSDPGKVKATLSKRDNIVHDDSVGLFLDMSGTQQSGYAFFVNPLGIQMDGIITTDGETDSSFDAVWTSAGRMQDAGYVVEIAIPLKSLRFPNKKELTCGIMAIRTIGRKSEELCAPPFNPKNGPVLAQLGKVRISGLAFDRTIEGIPALTFGQGNARRAGLWAPRTRQTDFSLTGKVGLTSDLTLDATYNPDFSQVETDAGQIDINLRNALYYPEKRPFFLEGLEDFAFAGALEQNPLVAVVHTRTIVDPSFGFKLTGKVGGRNQISSIFALDEYPGRAAAEAGWPGADRGALFGVVRYKRLFSKDGYLGGFFTRRGFNGGSNILGGLDGRYRLAKTMSLEYFAFNSWTDSGRAGGGTSGEALGLKYTFISRKSSVYLGAYDIGKDFKTETGFVTRTGVRMLAGLVNYKFYPKSMLFQRIDPYYHFTQTMDVPSGLFESQNFFALRFILPRQTMIRFIACLADEVFSGMRFRRDGYWISAGSQITKHFAFQFNLTDTKAVFYDPSAPYQGDGLRLTAAAYFQPTERLGTELSVSYSNFFRESDGAKIYDYPILRNKTTFQVNESLFFRGIFEYNVFHKRLTADLLASFTSIPGTVVYLGYGSAYEKIRWSSEEGLYRPDNDFFQTKKAVFFKASYLWRF
jgi:hypothetical protein